VIREEDQVQRYEGIKEASESKKVDHFEIFIYICERERERTLYLILLFILSQWRDFRIGVM